MIKEIIDNIDSIAFYTTEYREYIGVYKDHIIYSYPYAIQVYRIFKPTSCTFYTFNNNKDFIELFSKHYNDNDNDNFFNPCDLYEQISKIPLHTNRKLVDTKNLEIREEQIFIENKKIVDKLIINSLRKSKLEKINSI
jgi:hypothetical protein